MKQHKAICSLIKNCQFALLIVVQVNIITINIDRTVKLFQGVRRISKWTSITQHR